MKTFFTHTLVAAAALVAVATTAHATPAVQQVVTPSGLKALLVTSPRPAMVDVSLSFTCGRLFDPAGKEGMAKLASTLYNESVDTMDSQAFRKASIRAGAQISASAGGSTFTLSLRALSAKAPEAFALFGKAVTKPAFAADDVERMRSQLLLDVQAQAEDPDAIASKVFMNTLLPGTAYARTATEESLGAITIDDLKAFHSRCLTRANMIVNAVGDITPDRFATLLDTALADLPQGSDAFVPPAVPAAVVPGTTHVDMDVPQTTIVAGITMDLSRKDADFWPMYVANHILGNGDFTCVLMGEVREKRGLVYGIYSSISLPEGRALFEVNTATENKNAAEVKRLITSILTDVVANGFTEEQLQDAKTYLNGSVPLQLGSNGNILYFLDVMQRAHLPLDYFDTRADKVNAVTVEQIKQALARHIHPDQLTFVTVGGEAE